MANPLSWIKTAESLRQVRWNARLMSLPVAAPTLHSALCCDYWFSQLGRIDRDQRAVRLLSLEVLAICRRPSYQEHSLCAGSMTSGSRPLSQQIPSEMPYQVSEGHASGRPRHYVAPWCLAYAILGLITSGMLPFLMPLMVASTTSEPGRVAYVLGAYNIGLLAAPLLGRLAQCYQLFRPVFFGGFIALALGLGAATQTSAFASWVPLALLCGLGAGAVATVAPLFVIDFAPKDEWDARIGWLQSFSGGGQLAGLLIAGLIAQGPLAYGFWVAAGCQLWR